MHPRTCMVVGLLKNCNALVSLLSGSFGACVCSQMGLVYLCELVEASVSYLCLTFYFRFWGRVSHWIWSTLFWLLWLSSSQGIPITASYMLNLPMGHHANLTFMWALGIELESSHFCGKDFIPLSHLFCTCPCVLWNVREIAFFDTIVCVN